MDEVGGAANGGIERDLVRFGGRDVYFVFIYPAQAGRICGTDVIISRRARSATFQMNNGLGDGFVGGRGLGLESSKRERKRQ